jgi:hypothetical protein
MHHHQGWQQKVHALAVTVLLGCLAGGSLALLRAGLIEHRTHEILLDRQARIRVKPPDRLPIPSQRDIDIALELYTIRIGSHIRGPTFDPDLEDRGLTFGATLPGPRTVNIGPAAFTSWAVLGSTLGHEIEMHGQQSFLSIVLLDELSRHFGGFFRSWTALARTTPERGWTTESSTLNGTYGTWKAERDAYQYELREAHRFGLSQEEQQLILSVMRTYYPDATEAHAANQ